MKKTKVVLLGSRPLSKKVLAFLLEQADVDLVGVLTLPSDNAQYWADEPDDFRNIPLIDDLDKLDGIEFDLGISVNYWKKIQEPLLSKPRLGFINVHHTYNLRLRGRNCTSYAILRARKDNIWHHGSTLHFMSDAIDAGQIICSWACPITECDTAESLFQRVEATSLSMIREWLPRVWRENVITYAPPDECHSFKYRELEDEKLVDLDMDKIEIYDRVRAFIFPPFEPPYAKVNGVKRHLTIIKEQGKGVAVEVDDSRMVYWID